MVCVQHLALEGGDVTSACNVAYQKLEFLSRVSVSEII